MYTGRVLNALRETEDPAKRREILDALHRRYCRAGNRRRDPVHFVHGYADPDDRDVAALVASSLAYGNIKHILRSVEDCLGRLSGSPVAFVTECGPRRVRIALEGFKHRFCKAEHMAALLTGARRLIREYGSLRACFAAGAAPGDETVLPALRAFAVQLRHAADDGACEHLVPDPAAGSACKRLNLLLRWMIRRDAIDPGGWTAARPSQLIIPLDTHLHRIGRWLGFTRRASADMTAALELTAGLRRIDPDDPIRYDFALTHAAIDSARNRSQG